MIPAICIEASDCSSTCIKMAAEVAIDTKRNPDEKEHEEAEESKSDEFFTLESIFHLTVCFYVSQR